MRLASDPFEMGWYLFGTARLLSLPIILDIGVVSHTQVGLVCSGTS